MEIDFNSGRRYHATTDNPIALVIYERCQDIRCGLVFNSFDKKISFISWGWKESLKDAMDSTEISLGQFLDALTDADARK